MRRTNLQKKLRANVDKAARESDETLQETSKAEGGPMMSYLPIPGWKENETGLNNHLDVRIYGIMLKKDGARKRPVSGFNGSSHGELRKHSKE